MTLPLSHTWDSTSETWDSNPLGTWDSMNAVAGIFGDAENTSGFTAAFNYFHLRSLRDITVDADITLVVTNKKSVNADILISVKNYPPVTTFEVRQHVDENKITLLWTNPTAAGFVSTRIVKKFGSYPINENDGTIIYEGAGTAFTDTYLNNGTIYYGAFANYSGKYTYPFLDATMPILFKLYNNVGKRFSRVYASIMYSLMYSFARVLNYMGVIDFDTAMKQLNVRTASAEFLELWGSWFGTRRYANESDNTYSQRIINNVITPRTIKDTILKAVRAVDGVVFVEMFEGSYASFFVGHSYIGFIGADGFETKADFIVDTFNNVPFYFDLLVTVKTGTDYQKIIDAVNDNKAAGIRYSIRIIEQI